MRVTGRQEALRERRVREKGRERERKTEREREERKVARMREGEAAEGGEKK